MEYTFRLIQCHEKIPHLTGWYWYIDSMDMLLYMMEKSSTGHIAESVMEVMNKLYKDKVAHDNGKSLPTGHYNSKTAYILEMVLMNEFEKGDREKVNFIDMAGIANDLFHAPKMKAFLEYGAIYIGANLIGFTMDTGQRVVEEVKTIEFIFPIKDEIITISKWPGGMHFYLQSSAQREFKEKFNTWDEAHEHALQFTLKENIKRKDVFIYMKQGD